MSKSETAHQETDPNGVEAELTDEEHAVFERLAERFDDDDEVGRICEAVLQSSEGTNEEASS